MPTKKSTQQPVSLWSQVIPFIVVLGALFIAFCLFTPDSLGFVGNIVRDGLTGLFSYAAWTIPVLMVIIGVFYGRDLKNSHRRSRIINCTFFLAIAATGAHALSPAMCCDYPTICTDTVNCYGSILTGTNAFTAGTSLNGGGFVGTHIGWLVVVVIGQIATVTLATIALFIIGLLLIGLVPLEVIAWMGRKLGEFASRCWKSSRSQAKYNKEQRNIALEEHRRAHAKNPTPPPVMYPTKRELRTEHRAIQRGMTPPPRQVRKINPDFADNAQAKPADPLANIDDLYMANNQSGTAPTMSVGTTGGFTISGSGANPLQPPPLPHEQAETPAYERPDSLRLKTEPVEGAVMLKKIFLEEGGAVLHTPSSTGNLHQPIEQNGDLQVTSLNLGGTTESDDIIIPPVNQGGISRRPLFGTTEAAVAPERSAPTPTEIPATAEYVLPPASLLRSEPKKNVNFHDEVNTKARKLVETLQSFKVKTSVVNVSRGPTITRYELAPDEGVRVKSIANLVDDIALSLATTGVRIEAPIPGKAAVGVEVPNSVRETVYLRELIDTPEFRDSPDKLTAALGVDVAGDPIYIDIAKMPHLLIAGTTGSGKSVCLNCLILSLLYKATPDEVKLIMIDRKKVEFNVYNKLPHLIVPVVSNNKKAAGALTWAVAEMENRYSQIEEMGVRDLFSYNKMIKPFPERKPMPQLVIFIDELADLMMTDRDAVEESICRIAQKGRAAGVHVVLGTQRPSVDVITGLIKANVPSRIAFTVASQVDSGTIIGSGGAEKLIGRGDMLFAPTGRPKPERAQCAFVSDSEVESVVRFILDRCGEAEYDESVADQIEREAERHESTGKGKKHAITGEYSTADDSGENDPMLKAAIQLAFESGKISTSLIQRRLSLGYGRAAALIDRLQYMGIVSPPDGQKPRTVLISHAEYSSLMLNDGE